MKICLINNLYKPYDRGGAVRILDMIAHGLKQAHHDVFIISSRPFTNAKKKQEKENDIKTYYFRTFNITSYYNLGYIPIIFRIFWHLLDMFDIGSYLKIKKILKKEKPEIVNTHNLKGVGFLIPKLIKKLNIKHVHTLHDIQLLHPSGLMLCGKEKRLNNILSKIYSYFCRYLFSSPDIIISPSKWLANLHLDKGFFKNSKLFILPNPIEENNLHKKLQIKRSKKFRFLYVGQIEEHKGILFLIKTLKLLSDDSNNDNFELVIVGVGSKIKKARKLARNDINIIFKKWENKDDGIKEMLKSDCLIVPSLCYENSPTVIYEAASVGLPVIASRIGGIAELIHEFGGFLFKPGNESDLMYQMGWVMENSKDLEKIREMEIKKIKKFSIENYLEKILFFLKNNLLTK
ncbi:MAG: glycosyltransferase [Patescibacteria group bacterium]